MTDRNPNLAKLVDSYLFPKVRKIKEAFVEKNPKAEVISLSIGDTTEPLTPFIAEGLASCAQGLSTLEGYRGYGPEQGIPALREKIAKVIYNDIVEPNSIFVSDGAKCDIARLQMLFGKDASIAIQDPAYPVYVDSSIIIGQENIIYMPCTAENDFFPDLSKLPRTDLIFFCSPNNPTGATATREQLTSLVEFARKNHSMIIFDAAYSLFISDPAIPKSIYEIEGAKEVAIEIGSFSKLAGFTGVRLSWTVVPDELRFSCGTPVSKDWNRIQTTCFNGASIISQAGGRAALDTKGIKEMRSLIHFYMENVALLKKALINLGFEVHGGVHIPYLWVKVKGKNSWQAFEELLETYHIVTTPGSGFGPAGEGYLRFSAFSHRDNILKAIQRL